MDRYVTKQEFDRSGRGVARLTKEDVVAELKNDIGEMNSKHFDRLIIKIRILVAVEMIFITIILTLVQMYFAR